MKFLQMIRYASISCPFRRSCWVADKYLLLGPKGMLQWSNYPVEAEFLGRNPEFDLRHEDLMADDWEVGLLNVEEARSDGMPEPKFTFSLS